MFKICRILIVLILLTFLYFPCVNAQDKPEVFVQTGHRDAVQWLAIDDNERFLASLELRDKIKIWDIHSGRQLSSIVSPTTDHMFFVKNNLVITSYKLPQKLYSLEVYNTSGIRIETLKTLIPDYGTIEISNNRKYLYANDYPAILLRENGWEIEHIINLEDGSEIKLPDFSPSDRLYNLGSCIGHFKKISPTNLYDKGKIIITLYDKETLKSVSKFQIDATEMLHLPSWAVLDHQRKYLYASPNRNDLEIFDINTGKKVCDIYSRKSANNLFMLKNGDIVFVYSQTDRENIFAEHLEISILHISDNCLVKEKKLYFKEASSWLITNSGYIIAGYADGSIKIHSIYDGSVIKELGTKPVVYGHPFITNNKLLDLEIFRNFKSSEATLKYNLWDLNELKLEKFNITATSKLIQRKGMPYFLNPDEIYSKIPCYFFKDDYKLLCQKGTNESNLEKILKNMDMDSKWKEYIKKDYGEALETSFLTFLKNETEKFYADFRWHEEGNHISLYIKDKLSGKKEVARLYAFTDGEWVVMTPEGYYTASSGGEKHINVRIGNNVYSIENYREAFYRPDLVKLALAGSSLKDYKTLADIKQPPIVEIIDTPASTDKDELKLTVKLIDQGGGIGDVRLYLNETAVLVDSARGVKIVAKAGEKTIYKTYTIKLLNGENTIKAVAFNGDNTMQSNPAYHKVMASLKVKKPSLYAVVIGINEYKNPKLELKYAVADAKLFADTLKSIASPLFEKVEVNLLTTKEQTTKETIKKTLEKMKKLSPEDVFVFYVASHGTVDEGEYFLITSNVGSLSTFRLKEDALTQTELKELIANVPSTKKFIVIDTCNAGKLGEALQVAMLTRGMSEETAMKILSKAVGSTILSASTSLQEALEGYQGHGLFTYVLTEGMKGKADTDRDGFIRTLELANYVDSEVPALAEKVFKRAQYPTATPSGQAFPIGKVR